MNGCHAQTAMHGRQGQHDRDLPLFTNNLCSDDPTILAWGLANEPRCDGDRACTVVPFWADAMARHLKSLDPHHLVTLVGKGRLLPTGRACTG